MSRAKNWVREQFCHQLDFFDLQIVKKLQLIYIAACRLRFKLAETNLIDTFLHTEHCRHINCKECSVYCLNITLSFKMNKCVYKNVYYIYIYNTYYTLCVSLVYKLGAINAWSLS